MTYSTSKSRLRLWLRLLKLSRIVEAQLREKMRREFNSTLPRFDVLAALSRTPEGLRMSDLSSTLKVSNGNVTGIVDRLVNDDLATRVPVPGDRRAAKICLTASGRKQFDIQAKAHERMINQLLGGFSAEEAQTLTEHFDSILRMPLGERA
ncbi:MarR family winged helix-turn-helix transcriptional regulator [Flexibacterium corallicola]|uniref:MarR family winged helix-turn-helix transcriptional regulator n=1 Tax=Flexibacterium corallicola TaxID=3037259 RepID=UPI00286F76DC|nr:MarR family transcriptional regulator [Pseudovibrio sp. M1P-2-3]